MGFSGTLEAVPGAAALVIEMIVNRVTHLREAPGMEVMKLTLQ